MLTFKTALWLQLVIMETVLVAVLSLSTFTFDITFITMALSSPILVTLIFHTLAQKQFLSHRKQEIEHLEALQAKLQATARNATDNHSVETTQLETQSAKEDHDITLAALENMPEGVLIYQQDSLLFANPSAMNIFKVDHLKALNIDQYFPSDLQKNLQLSRQTGAPFLSATYNIIDNQLTVKQARIRVTIDKDYCFVFIEDLTSSASPSSIAVPKKKGLSGKNILLVEDSPANQMLMKGQLETQGASVDCADDGVQGINQAKLKAYDLILMDLQMPTMDGINAAKHIKDLPQHTMTPIIAMSGTRNEEIDKAIQQVGIEAFIHKPVSNNDLIKTLSDFFERAHSSVNASHKENSASQELPFDQDVIMQMQQDIGKQRTNDMTHVAIEEIEKRLTTLEQGIHDSSLLDLKRQAHTIKSTAASFGLMSLSALCHLIELNCRDGRDEEIATQTAQAREIFDCGKEELLAFYTNAEQE
ncbi:response regulator [Marinomonas transparens]|uniref:Response regulator n=1 Tax=Marinomonas transparens TaxID=2795388 RepID=A0A934JTZ7_9GAMM|nr:response regulator [Marinomonas transparens]MBJ7538262.1 response regulator [Marinomonas transparens]